MLHSPVKLTTRMNRLLYFAMFIVVQSWFQVHVGTATAATATTTKTKTCRHFHVVKVNRKDNKQTAFYSIKILKTLLDERKAVFTVRISDNDDVQVSCNKGSLRSVRDNLYTFNIETNKNGKKVKRSRNRQTFTPFMSLIVKLEYPVSKKPKPKILHFTVGTKFQCKVPELKLPDVVQECKSLRLGSCSEALEKVDGGHLLHLENVTQLNMFVLKLDFARNVSNLNISNDQSVGVKEVLSLQLCGWSYYFLIIRSDLKPLRLFFTSKTLPEVKYIYYGDYFCNSSCGKKTTC